MPEGRTSFPDHFDQAMTAVRRELMPQLQARPLSAGELADHRPHDFVAGWRIQAEFSVGIRQLDLLFDKSFPFSAPRVALVNPPPPLTYPHLEAEGKLCLLPDSASINHHLPVEVTQKVLHDVYTLLSECYAGTNQEDFRQEFLSYWTKTVKTGAPLFLSLLAPAPPSRLIRVWKGKTQVVVGEDEATIKTWLSNLQGTLKSFETETAAFFWHDQPLLPSEYPHTSNDLFGLIKNISSQDTELLYELTAKNSRQATVMLGMMTDSGPCLAGVTAFEPEEKHFDKTTIHPLERGFRSGKTPPHILSQRFWQAATPVSHSVVARADAAWIHGRGKDTRQEKLSAATVILIGCGSIGSHIAGMLAQAGIGRLILIDPETLSWANIGRHKLGAAHVGQSKAEALAKELRASYPHLKIEFREAHWEDVLHKEPELFLGGQLIISATGNWSSESALNVWHQEHRHQVPILYGWTEAHACAGHAVVITNKGGCLECGMSEFGVPHLRVAEWRNATTELQEPACGAVFQPYGPIELNHTNTVIAEMALDVLLGKITDSTHHIWACRRTFLQDCGGDWSREWQALPSYQAVGGYTTTQAWRKTLQCLTCKNQLTHNASLSHR